LCSFYYPKSVIRISLCRTAKRNPNDRFGFKVITEDKSNEKYLRELSNIISQIYKIGVLYNEAVKTLNYYHSTATAQRMLRKIETYSEAIIKQQVQAIKLTEEYSNTE